MDSEKVVSTSPIPATLGICGTSLFDGLVKDHRGANGRGSIFKSCKCFSVEEELKEEGSLHYASCSLPSPPVSLAKKVGAEFIGTLMLIFAATATAIVNKKTNGSETLIGLASSAGLAAMVVILSTGHISGAHLNPAITISFAALKHFPWKHVPAYIGAQVVASLCAAFALNAIFHPIMGGGVTVPSGGCGQAFALEFIISFNLMFVTILLLWDRETTGASMNPVRTLGPAIAAHNFKDIWVYLTAPILGALCGAGTYCVNRETVNFTIL